MNREIKFRGKRVDTGEWVYGCLAYAFKGVSFIMPKWYFATKDLGQEDEQAIADSKEVALGGFVKVEKDSVGEFTGLKDENGKEIYEGDVVSDGNYNREVIRFVSGEWALKRNGTNYISLFPELGFIEIIGDIYENPELLEQ